ncbi:MAG TPA: LysM peptidoglycan-binding domain-containing protein, partial [Phycisphaerales bacterium]|nr:LysM peptidoglycan-binding domain-containing protein [Phycisphaerales bacterium]
NGSSGAVYYDSKPAYDANSNISKVENAWVTPWSAVYASDEINRLEKATVGTMVTGAIANAATLRQEDWTNAGAVAMSQTGNWTKHKAYRDDPSTAAAEQNQTRTFLGRNEPYTVSDSVTGNQDSTYLVAHNGSVTRDDYVSGVTRQYGYRYTYDAWNRLVKAAAQSNGTAVTEYRYNGLGHRIGWKAVFDTNLTYANNLWRFFQYNERWQQVGMWYESSAGSKAVGTYAVETYLYHTAGLNGRGGSSYIDSVILRDRDKNSMASGGDATREERFYYLQNWRADVAALITPTGEWVERYRYDAYGRPESYNVADIAGSGGGGVGPDGTLGAGDTGAYSATGSADWNTDLGSASGSLVPDNVVNATDDLAAFTAYYNKGSTGGVGLISATAIDNRKGLAGYEFDPILAGTGKIDGDGVPVYHVRHRVLNSYSGKWMQQDALRYQDGPNLFEYVASMPLISVDPRGLDRWILDWLHTSIIVEVWSQDCTRVVGYKRIDFSARGWWAPAAVVVCPGRIQITDFDGPPSGVNSSRIVSCCQADRLLLESLEALQEQPPIYSIWVYNCRHFTATYENLGIDETSPYRKPNSRLVASAPCMVQVQNQSVAPLPIAPPPSQPPSTPSPCPPGFRPHTVKEGETCWDHWRRRRNRDISWEEARRLCANDPDRIVPGQTICVPE